jgi:hypothetical protein
LSRFVLTGNGKYSPYSDGKLLFCTSRHSESLCGSSMSTAGASGGSLFLLLILMVFILLPRGSLGDGYSIKKYINLWNPIWRNSRLGFLIGVSK